MLTFILTTILFILIPCLYIITAHLNPLIFAALKYCGDISATIKLFQTITEFKLITFILSIYGKNLLKLDLDFLICYVFFFIK